MPITGIEIMNKRRGNVSQSQLLNGPGKWTQAFGITTAVNGINLFDKKSPIQLNQSKSDINTKNIIATPRIGINYAEEWIDKPWRFILAKG